MPSIPDIIVSRVPRLALAAALLACTGISAAAADGAPFDLAGPKLAVTVGRGSATLPIDEVPNLAEHDVLKISLDLPSDQSAHFTLVLVFLRGSTNPPPRDWFHACEVWRSPCAQSMLSVEVPSGAQQALLLLAPSASGELRTMIDAVTGRPGAFVRAGQILRQAGLERSRLDAYLAALASMDQGERAQLPETTRLLARSLGLKVDSACLEDAPQAQVACLMQGHDSLVLSDDHSASLVENLTSGPSADLALDAANTPALGGGYYGPYVASLLNVGKLVSRMRSAQLQYLPAVADAHGDRLALTLNSPPSFHAPYSVLVTSLPAIAPARPPPMRPALPAMRYCAERKPLVLAVEGAPLAFSTRFLHDVRLRIQRDEAVQEIPMRADAAHGGFIADDAAPALAIGRGSPGPLRARLHGKWGFDDFNGPQFDLVSAVEAGEWTAAPEDALIAGRESLLHLKGAASDCVVSISAADATGLAVPVQWKASGDDAIELHLPLQHARPGTLSVRVARLGSGEPLTLDLPISQDVIHLGSIDFSPGDAVGVIRGAHLEQVKSVQIDHQDYLPGRLLHLADGDELDLSSSPPDTRTLPPLATRTARVTLRDGRRLESVATAMPARPGASLLSKTVDHIAHGDHVAVRLDGNDTAAPGEAIRFAVHANEKTSFDRDSSIDVASSDGQFRAALTVGHGLVLESAQTLVGSFIPQLLLGPSAFGPLQFRIDTGGVPGEWQDLVRLVRLPELVAVDCADAAPGLLRISGRELFLLARIGTSGEAARLVEVPEGFTGNSLSVPASDATSLSYVLVDDPSHVHRIELGNCGHDTGDTGNSPDHHGTTPMSRSQPTPESP